MSITPKTYKEWIAIRDALAQAIQFNATVPPARRVDFITEDVFGSCPPEPAPEPFVKGKCALVRVSTRSGKRWWVSIPGQDLTPDEAEAMAAALVEHAAYARNQTTTEEAT